MFLNLTNHPSALWSAEQTAAARQLYGDIMDLPFPSVDPAGDEEYITSLADDYVQRVLNMADGQPVAVHLMGEMTLTYAIVRRLQMHGITCVAATTKRTIHIMPDGQKMSSFKFIRFRKYL